MPLLCDNQRPRTATPWLRPLLNTARHHSTFPGEKLEHSICSGIEPSSKAYRRFICIGNGVRSKPTNIPLSHWQIVNCFSSFFVLILSQRACIWFSGSGLFFHSGKQHLQWSLHTPQARFHGIRFPFTTTTSWLAPGQVYGYNYNWQGFDTGGLFFSFILLSFLPVFKDKRNTQQCTSLGRDRDRTTPIWILDSPIFFISFLFVTRHREAFSEDTQHTKGSHGSANTFASLLIPSLCTRFTNDYNDDLYESMTDDYDSFRYNTT